MAPDDPYCSVLSQKLCKYPWFFSKSLKQDLQGAGISPELFYFLLFLVLLLILTYSLYAYKTGKCCCKSAEAGGGVDDDVNDMEEGKGSAAVMISKTAFTPGMLAARLKEEGGASRVDVNTLVYKLIRCQFEAGQELGMTFEETVTSGTVVTSVDEDGTVSFSCHVCKRNCCSFCWPSSSLLNRSSP